MLEKLTALWRDCTVPILHCNLNTAVSQYLLCYLNTAPFTCTLHSLHRFFEWYDISIVIYLGTINHVLVSRPFCHWINYVCTGTILKSGNRFCTSFQCIFFHTVAITYCYAYCVLMSNFMYLWQIYIYIKIVHNIPNCMKEVTWLMLWPSTSGHRPAGLGWLPFI